MLKSLKSIVCSIIFCIAISSCKDGKQDVVIKEPVEVYSGLDIYILMGQSNMSGRGLMTVEDKIVQNKKVVMLTKDLKWTPAKNPMHFDVTSPGVGPGLSFGIAMQEAKKDVEIGLVPTAVGGTGIDSWKPGGFDVRSQKYPYDDAEKRIVEAMKSGTVKGILWHQGEEDSKSQETINSYMPKLQALVARVRALVGDPNLPFVVGELGRFKQNLNDFNFVINKVPSEIPNTAIASSEGLMDKGDNLHFNTESAITLGRRYADRMLLLQKKK